MNRRERILQVLTENGNTGGMDASALVRLTGIDRANISRELNTLVREGKLIKLSGRPVRYFLYGTGPLHEDAQESDHREEFCFIMGEDGPLSVQVGQAKAAILYPPKGLHTLLIGQTGVGKTTFAERMHAYAVHMKVISEKAEFVSFNCAEYAENSQLLLAQLFGYVKGAFTGADHEKTGLVDKAEGGILFLDEIHRLPAEGQEILFHLIDKGTYRRLGETENTHKGNVLIIGATTEDPEKALLATFIRRIPMTIKIPSLEELPTIMRLQLAESFFRSEQKNIGASIRVEKKVLLALLLYKCSGNIGQLKADIQLLCARGFLDYKLSGKDAVRVDVSMLQDYIEKGLVRKSQITDDVVEFIEHSQNEEVCYEDLLTSNPEEGVYTEITQKYNRYRERGRSNREIGEILSRDLESYIEELKQQYVGDDSPKDVIEENVMRVLDSRIYQPVKEILQFAEIKLERPISPKLRVGFALHINALIERIEKGIPIENQKVDEIIKQYPKEYKLAKIIGLLLEEEFKYKIPEEEIGFLTLFLCDDSTSTKAPKIGVVVITHGENTATGMAEFANALLGVRHCRALDMTIDSSVDALLEQAVEVVKQADEGKGVVLLVDMGSLRNFGEIISHKNHQKVVCVDMVSTLTVIEAVRKAVLGDITLEALGAYLRMVPFYANQFKKEEVSEEGICTIIATCISGQGSAKKIGEIVLQAIPEDVKPGVVIRHMNLEDAKQGAALLEKEKIKNLKVIVGTVDLQIPGVPFISVDELLLNSGIRQIKSILGIDVGEIESGTSLDREILVNTLRGLLNYLDADKIIDLLKDTLNTISEELDLMITREIEIRYIVHVACMIERNLRGEVLPYKYLEEKKKQSRHLFSVIQKALFSVEEMWAKEVPETEIAYLAEIIEKVPQRKKRVDYGD